GNADENIADNAKAGATDDLTREPACNQADEQNDQQAFVGQIHETPPGHARRTGAASESLTIIVQCDEALRPGRTCRRGLLERNRYVAATLSAGSARMQRANRPGPISTWGGNASVQRGCAKPQRG